MPEYRINPAELLRERADYLRGLARMLTDVDGCRADIAAAIVAYHDAARLLDAAADEIEDMT